MALYKFCIVIIDIIVIIIIIIIITDQMNQHEYNP